MRPLRTDDEPGRTNGSTADTVTASTGLVEPRERRKAGGATSRLRRAPDYRLRGLDLDAQTPPDAPARSVRKGRRSRRQRRRLLVQWVVVLAVTAAVALALRGSVVESFSVSSPSMVPTLDAGTNILVVKPSALTGSIKAGSIVVFSQPQGFRCSAGANDTHHLVSRGDRPSRPDDPLAGRAASTSTGSRSTSPVGTTRPSGSWVRPRSLAPRFPRTATSSWATTARTPATRGRSDRFPSRLSSGKSWPRSLVTATCSCTPYRSRVTCAG